jgi:hypothetical protein
MISTGSGLGGFELCPASWICARRRVVPYRPLFLGGRPRECGHGGAAPGSRPQGIVPVRRRYSLLRGVVLYTETTSDKWVPHVRTDEKSGRD